MGLAAAVMKTLSSPMYGLRDRAQTVQQAITYLGTREIATLVYQVSLRSAFPAAAQLRPMWERSAVRALLMGRMAKELYLDAWCRHTAGLFEECGMAALFKLAPDTYGPMLSQAPNDIELVALETAAFGTSHDVLGANLCESWGLDAGAALAPQAMLDQAQLLKAARRVKEKVDAALADD